MVSFLGSVLCKPHEPFHASAPQAQMRHITLNLIVALSATFAFSGLLIGFTMYDAAEMVSIAKAWVDYNIFVILTLEQAISMMCSSKILWTAASITRAWLVRLQ